MQQTLLSTEVYYYEKIEEEDQNKAALCGRRGRSKFVFRA